MNDETKDDSWPYCEPCGSWHAPENPTCVGQQPATERAAEHARIAADPPAPKTLDQILAETRKKIESNRWMAPRSSMAEIWTTITIDNEEIERVIDAIPTATLPDIPDVSLTALGTWHDALEALSLTEREGMVAVQAADLWSVLIALQNRIAKEQREAAEAAKDRVRVSRMVTYEGERRAVEAQLLRSLHGRRENGNGVTITAVTLDLVPERIAVASLPTARDLEMDAAGEEIDRG